VRIDQSSSSLSTRRHAKLMGSRMTSSSSSSNLVFLRVARASPMPAPCSSLSPQSTSTPSTRL